MSSTGRDTALTGEELRRRTLELVPVLRERAARTEELRQIPSETVQDLVSSSLIRIGNPPRYGGLDIEYDAVFDVGYELGRACGSTAWCYCLWTAHNWWIGHFPEQVLSSVIPRSVRVSEAPGYGQSVITYDPGSRGATSYLEAAREIAQRGASGVGTS